MQNAPINKITILLSFEKFLSNVPPIIPTIAKHTEVIPIFFPIHKSIKIPYIIPYIIPLLLPINSPIKSANITTILGITPAIVKFTKNTDCNKYININTKIKDIYINAFFMY